MYVPKRFLEDDRDELLRFVERYDFATLVSGEDSGAAVSHLPLVLRREGDRAVLIGHLARANDHWKLLDGARATTAIFLGPHAYISPTWYASRPRVPTWNYASVHATGPARVHDDDAWTLASLEELVQRHEAHRDPAWSVDELGEAERDALLKRVIGFELPIERLEGKYKLDQNGTEADRAGAMAGLEAEGTAEAATMARFMRSGRVE